MHSREEQRYLTARLILIFIDNLVQSHGPAIKYKIYITPEISILMLLVWWKCTQISHTKTEASAKKCFCNIFSLFDIYALDIWPFFSKTIYMDPIENLEKSCDVPAFKWIPRRNQLQKYINHELFFLFVNTGILLIN
jgi:hypothetical protein